jgi:hypothetical protein
MERFSNAKPGDKVYCLLRGEGEVIKAKSSPEYPVSVKFDSNEVCSYTEDGKACKEHTNPVLFYRTDTGNMLTERPVAWHEVPKGTVCESRGTECYFYDHIPDAPCPYPFLVITLSGDFVAVKELEVQGTKTETQKSSRKR